MTKSKFGIFIDSFLISFSVFLITLIWLKRYIKNAFLFYFISIIASIIVFVTLFKSQNKKSSLIKLNNQETKFARICFKNITLMSENNLIKFIQTTLNSNHISKNLYESNTSLFCVSLQKKMEKTDLIYAYNYHEITHKNKELVFIAEDYTEEFKSLSSEPPCNFPMFYYNDFYNIMKENNIFPISKNSPEKITSTIYFKKLFSKFKNSLSKTKFKSFFFSGLSLLIFSVFIPYSTYYLIIGTSLLILSIMCLLSKNNLNKKPKQSLLDIIKKDAKN